MAYTDIDKPTDYFNTILWTGASNTAGRSFTGVGFQPDLVWSKIRDDTYHHNWFDSVRGAGSDKEINSDTSGAEGSGDTDGYGFISSFDTDGFTSTPGTASGGRNLEYNQSGNTFVAWNWKAGNGTASNTDGSITSTVSANTTSGFSIVSYTGNGSSGSTIGHGLNAVPEVVLIRRRNQSTDWNFQLGYSQYLKLNSTDQAIATSGGLVGSGSTSTITVDANAYVNASGDTYIAYCFAGKKGFSKAFSYNGNGSTDGSFTYLGFRPAWVMIKRTDSSASWTILDNKRDSFNVTETRLFPDTNDADTVGANGNTDFLSNGIKMRTSHLGINASGGSYIGIAFAENPLVSSAGVPCTAR